MPTSIIDAQLFSPDILPWPNQVFQKDFDAYFLLSYPQFQYNETEVYNPYGFMANIQERTVYIQTPNGSKSINHTMPIGIYEDEMFYKKFAEQFTSETYLLWEGENDKWAMVSDAKNKVCVFATHWSIADQIPLFYEQYLLSPQEFLQKVGMQKHEAIFMKNYAPSSVLAKGDDDNKVWKKYFFQCHVENENDKLFYWPQFEQFYESLSKLLKPFKGLDMYACQAFERRYWRNKQWYGSGKNAPVGGWQKFSAENCKKVATKFLIDNEHLKLEFDGKQEEAEKLYIANKKGLIKFYGFNIYANRIKQKTKGSSPEFVFSMGLYDHSNKQDKYNQQFHFFYQADLLSEDAINLFVHQLKTFCAVEVVHKIAQPKVYADYTNDKSLQIHSIYTFVPEIVKQNHQGYQSSQNQ
jgi:hypothetical protein